MTPADLAARLEIRDVLSRYCRGLDRMDREMALSVFHEGSRAHYVDIYEGTGAGFVAWVWEAHAAMERHSHQITNVLVELDGDRAASEAYVTVVLWTRPDGTGDRTEIVARGRYLDRWSRRDGRWAIDERVYVLDAQSAAPLAGGVTSEASRRDEQDPSFDFIPKA